MTKTIKQTNASEDETALDELTNVSDCTHDIRYIFAQEDCRRFYYRTFDVLGPDKVRVPTAVMVAVKSEIKSQAEAAEVVKEMIRLSYDLDGNFKDILIGMTNPGKYAMIMTIENSLSVFEDATVDFIRHNYLSVVSDRLQQVADKVSEVCLGDVVLNALNQSDHPWIPFQIIVDVNELKSTGCVANPVTWTGEVSTPILH
jgi:hypothetical protein